MHLKIDSREHNEQMFDAFDILTYEKGWTYEKAFLDVGDVACGNIVIERKEAGDFVHSIMDGRLKEQAAKMCMNYEHKYIIVEGSPFQTESAINQNAIIGKMTSLAVKHNIKLLFVEDPKQFAYACMSIIEKHFTEGVFNPAEHNALLYKADSKDILVAMLYQIPRLGWDKAKKIAEKCHYSLRTLVSEATKERLMEIEGIGDVMAERILSFVTK